MKNWIMIVTMTKEMRGKDSNGIFIFAITFQRERAEVNEWIESAHGLLVGLQATKLCAIGQQVIK